MSTVRESKLFRPTEPKPTPLVRVSRDVVTRVAALPAAAAASVVVPSYTISLKDILILWLLAIALLLSWNRIQRWIARFRWTPSSTTPPPTAPDTLPPVSVASTPDSTTTATKPTPLLSDKAPVTGPGWCVVAEFADHGAARGCAYVPNTHYCASGKLHATKVECLLPPKKESPKESEEHETKDGDQSRA